MLPRRHRCLGVICPIFPHLSSRQEKLSITLYAFVYSSGARPLKELQVIVQQKLHLHLKHSLSASLTWATLESSLIQACSFVLQTIKKVKEPRVSLLLSYSEEV